MAPNLRRCACESSTRRVSWYGDAHRAHCSTPNAADCAKVDAMFDREDGLRALRGVCLKWMHLGSISAEGEILPTGTARHGTRHCQEFGSHQPPGASVDRTLSCNWLRCRLSERLLDFLLCARRTSMQHYKVPSCFFPLALFVDSSTLGCLRQKLAQLFKAPRRSQNPRARAQGAVSP